MQSAIGIADSVSGQGRRGQPHGNFLQPEPPSQAKIAVVVLRKQSCDTGPKNEQVAGYYTTDNCCAIGLDLCHIAGVGVSTNIENSGSQAEVTHVIGQWAVNRDAVEKHFGAGASTLCEVRGGR